MISDMEGANHGSKIYHKELPTSHTHLVRRNHGIQSIHRLNITYHAGIVRVSLQDRDTAKRDISASGKNGADLKA